MVTMTHTTDAAILDRARPRVAHLDVHTTCWRRNGGFDTTGLPTLMAVMAPATPNRSVVEQTIKRPARHLRTRST